MYPNSDIVDISTVLQCKYIWSEMEIWVIVDQKDWLCKDDFS